MRSIWAVAVNTIRQAFRLKIAAVFVLLLIVLLPVMGFVMTGDGTVKGRLQSFVSYSLALTSLLLCLFTIVVSIYSITDDIKQKRIHTVLTKPIRRFELILGKLFGVLLLDVIVLVPCAVLIYGITINTPKFLSVTPEDQKKLNNEFFTARAGLKPSEADVTGEVLKLYEELKEKHQLPAGMSRSQIIRNLINQKKLERRAAGVGQELVWEFNGVKPFDPNQSVFIRFKYDVSVNPPDLNVYSRWVVGDIRQIKFGGKSETPVYFLDRKDLIRTFHEINVPADAVAQDGYLSVAFVNIPLNDTVVIFPPDEGLEVLYKADSFTANFVRAVLLIFFRLIFLACLGVLASSFLSFPVAILLALAVFFTATISSFILESFNFLSDNASGVYSYTLKPLVQLIPQFDKFNPSAFLVPARLLSWPLLAEVAGLMVCVKALLILLLALLIFRYREIAKIVV